MVITQTYLEAMIILLNGLTQVVGSVMTTNKYLTAISKGIRNGRV
jgi:hypothetical protein